MIRSILPLNRVLLVVVAVLSGLLVALERGIESSRVVEPLFPAFDGGRAVEIGIAAPESDGTVTLRRAAPGEPWSVEELRGAPASGILVEGFLSRIGSMSTLDLVSDDAADLTEYGLGEDAALRVTVVGAATPAAPEGTDGAAGDLGDVSLERSVIADLFLALGPDGASFVRRAGEVAVYRLPRFPRVPDAPFDWFDRRSFVPYEEVQIARLTARGPGLDGSVVVLEQPVSEFGSFRDAAGGDVPRVRALDVFQRLRALFPTAVLDRRESGEMDPDAVRFEVEIELRSGNDFRVQFGRSESGPVPAMRAGDPIVLGCDAEAVQGALEALRALTL
ncbi:MAG: DUF4340 domain-containing protein [Planctomycetota bacterium]